MATRSESYSLVFKTANFAAVLLVLAGAYVYAVSAGNFLGVLRQGSTGAWCLDCLLESSERRLTVLPNSPAERSGIATGDVILTVEDTPFEDVVVAGGRSDETWFEGLPWTELRLSVRNAAGETTTHKLVRETGWNDIITTGLQIVGLPPGPAFAAAMLAEAAIILGFAGTGLFIWSRRHSWLTFLAGLSLILLVFPTTRIPLFLELGLTRTFFFSTALIVFYILFYLFPDGKLYPKWAPTLITIYLAWLVFNGLIIRPLLGGFDYSRLLDIFFWAIALRAQLTRYRQHSTPEEKQQIKWVLAGFFVAVIERSAFLALLFLVPALMFQESSTLLSHLFVSFGDLGSRLLFLVIPVTFILSIFRFGLWEIDYVINRSIIYGTLTVLLGLVFAGTLYLTQLVLSSFLGGGQVMAVSLISAAVATLGLFPRLQVGLRRWVDAWIFGINLDYKEQARAEAGDLFKGEAGAAAKIQGLVDIRLIGRGGMGEVYSGLQPDANRRVAVKILPRQLARDEASRRRFLREAEIASRLDHPNIVRTFDFGELDGNPFIVMEYIQGIDLETLLASRSALPFDHICGIVMEIGSALAYSHGLGIVHRDLKPSNIMIETQQPADPFSGGFRSVLTDFGIAKILDDSGHHSTAGIKGTFEYLAPEQINEATTLTPRADIYAAGVVFYRLLTGRLPFENTNLAKLLLAHLHRPAEPPSSYNPGIPEQMNRAVLRALEKDPQDRYPSIGQFVEEFCQV